MSTRDNIRFIRRGEVVELTNVGPNETILDYLRLRQRDTGTKEGCAEGDCGACTVAVGVAGGRNGAVEYLPVNACIQPLIYLDGKELVTVDDLASGGVLHPVQDAMVKHHASQCGFCTPGFVMSLFVMHQNGEAMNRAAINDTLAGNLCRCTGYRPIVDAALSLSQNKTARPSPDLPALGGGSDHLYMGNDDQFIAAPASLDALAGLYQRHPDATLIAGSTDVGLWLTKKLMDIPKVIWLGRVAGLDNITTKNGITTIGAGTTYHQATKAIAAIGPDFAEVLRRIGSRQVRAVGTIGGNIANGSPIGDTPPVLIALGAKLDLRHGDKTRQIPLEDFFIDYGKQDRAPGEFVTAVHVPHPGPDQRLFAYKISKRFDQDISALLAAFLFTIKDDTVIAATLAFGGMAATPKRATVTERALIDLQLSDQNGWSKAAERLASDFTPLTDMRASADYRLETAKALILKARLELTGKAPTRILGGDNAA